MKFQGNTHSKRTPELIESRIKGGGALYNVNMTDKAAKSVTSLRTLRPANCL